MKPYLICILFMIFYYGVCVYALVCDGGLNYLKNVCKNFFWVKKISIFFMIIISILISVYWIKQNHFIYYWDYSTYWRLALNRMNYMFEHSVTEIFESLYTSINNDEYNVFLPTIVALPMKIFGYTFSKYVFVNNIFFLVPAVFIQAFSALKIIKNTNLKKDSIYMLVLALALFFPANYYAMYKGYIDIAILLPISIAMYLFFDYDFTRISLSRNIAISAMLLLAWISRRYAIYFVIGYVVALLIKALFTLIKEKSGFINIIVNFITIGGFSFVILITLFKTFFLNALLTNYREMYSAYDAPLIYKINGLASFFGYFPIIIIVITGILCLVKKRNRVNYISILGMFMAEIILFWQTQDMGYHHKIILNLPVFMMMVLIIDFWPDKESETKKTSIIKIALISVSIGVMFLNYYKVFVPVASRNVSIDIFSEKYTPFQRWDIPELNNLAEYLNEITTGTEDKIYVTASGGVLNSAILRNLYMPFSENAVPSMWTTYDVDLRDGFPNVFLYSTYVVTTDPVELHLSSGQEVVRYLAVEVQNPESYIGCHYEQINEFQLDNGVKAKVYKRVSDWTEEDFVQLREYFYDLYPDNTEIFLNRIQ